MNILIAGDFCPNDRVARLIDAGDRPIISERISDLIKGMDYSIVNLECPVADKECHPILKKGPNLSCKNTAITHIVESGFRCVTLANNHFRDYGDRGCVLTLNEIKNHRLDSLGGGKDIQSAQKVLYKRIGNKTLAFVNFCESEFSIATTRRAGSAAVDAIDNYRQINEARQNADFVIVIVHGGHEFFQLPSLRMKKYYRWLIDIGADVVVNHHQHCFSGFEKYNGKYIFYGLGNFCFDWPNRRDSIWNYGYMVELIINDDITYKLHSYSQCNEQPCVNMMSDEEEIKFNKDIETLNSIIKDEELFEAKLNEFYDTSLKDCEVMMGNQSDNKLVRYIKRKHLFPSKLSDEKVVILYDYIFCDSHREKVEYLLNWYLK